MVTGAIERWALIHGSLLHPVKVLLDRVMFFLVFQRAYRKMFRVYGKGVRWGRNGAFRCIPSNVRISGQHLICIHDDVQIDEGVYLQCHLEGEGITIGKGCRINAHTHIQSYASIVLERDVLIAPFCHISSSNHTFGASSATPILQLGVQPSGIVRIGAGSWIGRSAHILGGVTLGTNCVVGAGAVVTRGAEAFAVLVGVPASPVSKKKVLAEGMA